MIPALTNQAGASEVSTGSATPLGLQAMTVNGRIQPHGLPTHYWFEFGTDANLGRQTAAAPLPPQLASFLQEDWQAGRTAGWGGGMSQRDMQAMTDPKTGEGFIRITEPTGDDPNHVDGVGTLHLSKFIYSGLVVPRRGGSAYLGGGEPDFRDAEISLVLRGQDFKPNGTELLWWTQRMIDASEQFTDNWECTNWAYTGVTLTDALASGQWEKVSYRLANNSELWSYAGNNLAQERAERYVYAPLDQSLGNINADFFHLLCFVDPAHPPTGSIDFSEISLRYRNYSLLRAANGGALVRQPGGAADPAERLTDGWRHGPERMWRSGANPAEPQEFVYRLAPGARVETIMVHQNTEWPAKEVEVLASADGSTWTPLLRRTLEGEVPLGPNFNFARERVPAQAAGWVKVRILSGYQPEHWGLGEVEVIGSGVAWATDDDWYNVNADIAGLQPGTTYHYRLVAENASGRITGPTATFTTPANRSPMVQSGAAKRITAHAALLTGRLAPLGLRTDYYFEYGRDAAYGKRTVTAYGGMQESPRLAQAAVEDLEPGVVYHYRLVALNAAGTSYGDDQTFQTRAP